MTTNHDHLRELIEAIRGHGQIESKRTLIANSFGQLLDEFAALRKENEDMREALLVALPYVTDAEGFSEQFKPGVVRRHVKQVRAAIGDSHE